MRGGEQDDTLLQLNRWLEEYRALAETREHESFQLKLQIAQLFEVIRGKDDNERTQQAYVVDLEETVRALGDEMDSLRQQLAAQEKENRRLRAATQLSDQILSRELRPQDATSSEDEYNGLLSDVLSLHDDNARLVRHVHSLEVKLNDKESLCLDLRARVKELERMLSDQGILVEDIHMHRTPPRPELAADGRRDQPHGDQPRLDPLELAPSPQKSLFRHASSDEEELRSPVIRRDLSRSAARRTASDWAAQDPSKRTLSLFQAASLSQRAQYFTVESPERAASTRAALWSPESQHVFADDEDDGSEHEEEARKKALARPPPLPTLPDRDLLPTPPRVHRRTYRHK